MGANSFEFQVVTPERWTDLERLFGPRGACGGCWCMYWRLPHADYEAMKGTANRAALKAIVEAGEIPGLLAYQDGQPVGWVSVAPRAAFSRLERSRILKPVDERPVWSVVCFFVARPYRRQGLTVQLLNAAVEYARSQSAQIVEGYPEEPKTDRVPDVFAYTGLASAFRRADFEEVLRRSETRPIMRRMIDE
jgi:GNAT superfamily N-acetyltransferase